MNKKELFELQDCLDSAMTLVDKYQKLINPLLDPYFRGLSCPEIAELAKKSIRLTEENRRLEEALEEVKEYTIKQFCDNCEDVVSTEYNCHCEYCEYQKYFDIIQKVKQVKN